METQLKRWTKLGLGSAAAVGLLGGCGGEPAEAPAEAAEVVAEAPAETAPAPAPAPAAMAGEGGEGEGGEGGEGEGGVSISAAATDAVVYGSALAIAEAHVIAARDAYAAGETEAAAEMLAHPVSEVLADMKPIFAQLGVEDFKDKFVGASGAIFEGESAEQIAARTEDILATLRAAGASGPDDGRSAATVAAGIAVDQIERAADMYRTATGTDQYAPYLDGYGFYKAGEAAFTPLEAEIDAENADAAEAIRAALALLAEAYPTATRPDALDADSSALTAAASTAILQTSN